MYSDWVGPVPYGTGLLIVLIWLGVLSFLIWKQSKFLKSLFPKSGERDIRKKFEEVLKTVEDFGQDLDKLKSKLSEIEKLDLGHIQRMKLLRYNPYEDTGGDQSFTLALLDDKGNGFVLTSLHTRSVTRVFAKPVENGKALKHEFSQEEQKSIEQAMKD